jgi:hypothetical protein
MARQAGLSAEGARALSPQQPLRLSPLHRWSHVFEPCRQPRRCVLQAALVGVGEAGAPRHLPVRALAAGADHRRVRFRREGLESEAGPHAGQSIRHRVTDPDPLKVRQTDGAVLAPGWGPTTHKRQPGTERHGLVAPGSQETYCTACQGMTQIVMGCEQRPRRCKRKNEPQKNGWPSLKRPPGELRLRRPTHPVGVQPGLDVLVAGDGDELQAGLAADRAGQGGAADLGDGAVDDAGELVASGAQTRRGSYLIRTVELWPMEARKSQAPSFWPRTRGFPQDVASPAVPQAETVYAGLMMRR